jgi:hypothetical protein
MPPACEVAAQRVVTRSCRHCRADFAPVRRHQAFCRPSCRWESFKARRQAALLFEDAWDALARVPFE